MQTSLAFYASNEMFLQENTLKESISYVVFSKS